LATWHSHPHHHSAGVVLAPLKHRYAGANENDRPKIIGEETLSWIDRRQ
jgi:hypothetical protein